MRLGGPGKKHNLHGVETFHNFKQNCTCISAEANQHPPCN